MFFKTIGKYASLVKFSHTVFAMPFAIIGYMLGLGRDNTHFDWLLFLLVIVCMVCARSAAMAFNRYTDRYIDQKNPRTAKREIPAGKISPGAALTFVILSAICFITATWFINRVCFYLSPIALLVILGYSYTKRFTSLAHYVLGLGLSLAPIGAYLAVTGRFDAVPLCYSAVVFFWVAGFDIIYALQDRDFDEKERLHSIPARFGIRKALRISEASHIVSAIMLVLAGIFGQSGVFFWIGGAGFVALLIYQHLKVKPGHLEKIDQVFALTNGFAGLLLAIFYIIDFYAYIKI